MILVNFLCLRFDILFIFWFHCDVDIFFKWGWKIWNLKKIETIESFWLLYLFIKFILSQRDIFQAQKLRIVFNKWNFNNVVTQLRFCNMQHVIIFVKNNNKISFFYCLKSKQIIKNKNVKNAELISVLINHKFIYLFIQLNYTN